MSIDVKNEKLIYLADVPRLPWLPRRRNGRAPGLTSIRRWAKVGVRGIKLETVRMPFGLATTEPAILRFVERLSAPQAIPDTPTEKQVQARRDRAKKICEAMGV